MSYKICAPVDCYKVKLNASECKTKSEKMLTVNQVSINSLNKLFLYHI